MSEIRRLDPDEEGDNAPIEMRQLAGDDGEGTPSPRITLDMDLDEDDTKTVTRLKTADESPEQKKKWVLTPNRKLQLKMFRLVAKKKASSRSSGSDEDFIVNSSDEEDEDKDDSATYVDDNDTKAFTRRIFPFEISNEVPEFVTTRMVKSDEFGESKTPWKVDVSVWNRLHEWVYWEFFSEVN